jgi:hypothetical protein
LFEISVTFAIMSEGELPQIPSASPSRQRSDSVVQLSQFYASMNSTMLSTNADRGAFVDQYNRKGSKAAVPENTLTVPRMRIPENAAVIPGNKSSEASIVLDSSDKQSSPSLSKKSYLKMQALSLAADKQKKSVHMVPRSFIADQYKVHSESPIFHNHLTGEEGRSKEGEVSVPRFQKIKTSERNQEVVRWTRQEFPSEDALGTRHDVIALSRWLNSMYSKIPACKAWPPSVSDEEMSTAFERFLSTFSKDIFLNSTHPECLNVIMKSAADQHQPSSLEHFHPGEQDRSNPDEVLMPFRASIEVVDAVAGEIIRQISHDCAERAMLLDKVITQYKVVLREAWIMKQRAETEGISGLRNLLKQCEQLLISESKQRVVAECSNEHHVIKAQVHERKIQSCEKELEQSNVQIGRLRDQIDHCHRQLQEKDNALECKSLFLKDAKATIEVKQLHLENVLMRERQWEDKVRAMGSDPNCFLGIDVEAQVDQDCFSQIDPLAITRLVTPPEVRKARIERDAYAKSMAQLKKAESMSLSMKDLQTKKVQPVVAPRSTVVTQSFVDPKAQKEKELLAQQLKEKDALHLSLVNQSQQQIETLKQLQDELSGSKQMVTTLKESITALENSLAESEAQRKKSEADVQILLEETDALQKKQNGSIQESEKIEEVIREAKANIFKEQLLVKKLQEELESWKENDMKLSKQNEASREHAAKQKVEIQNLNSRVIVLERDLSVMTIESRRMQQTLDEKNDAAASYIPLQAVVVPKVICADLACQTDFVVNPSSGSTKASADKLKKTTKGAETVAETPVPAVVDEGPAHEKIKKATLQLRSDIKKKNEENQALLDKIKENDEKSTMQRAILEEKSAMISKLQAEKKDLVEKSLKLQSQLEIACRPPAPTEKVDNAVAALQVIGALSQMHVTSNQHEANEKLKRKLSALRDQEQPKLQLAQVMEKPKTPSADPEKISRKAKTPLLPAVVAQKVQMVDEADGAGDAEMHTENREQVLKLLATAQGIGKATKKFRRQVKVSSDDAAETNDTLELEARLREVEERCEVLTQNNDNLRAGNANKTEEISRLSFHVQKLKDELDVLAEQRATWLRDEQKRHHLESSVESAAQQTKKMMESMKKGESGAFKSVVNMLQASKQKQANAPADETLSIAVVTSAASIYVPKPEILSAAIPYMQFLKDETIQTPKAPKSPEWLNAFFEDVMSSKVCSPKEMHLSTLRN